MSKAIDMTKGSPFKNIFRFALPIGLGFALQNLYGLGDSLIVSLSRGADATTGVNLTGSISFLTLGFAQGITAGFGIVLSQYVGAKNVQKMKNSIGTSIVLTVIIALIVSAITTVLARPMLVMLETDEQFLEYSVSYIRAIFIGLVFNSLYNYTDQVMRALGDSKTPFKILILCAVLNIGLNSLLFVFDGLSVAWAGWATVISQAISALVGFIVIFKKFPEVRPKKEDFKLKLKFCLHHLGMGLPMAIQFIITASGCMVQQWAFNSLDNELYAMAQGAANKIDNIFGLFLNGAGVAMATYVGQNYGAREYDRIKKGVKVSFGVGAIFTVISMTCMLTLAVPMSRLLLPADTIVGDAETVYNLVFTYAIFQSSFYYALFMIFQMRQCVQAIGRSMVAMFGGVVEFAMRVFIAFTFAKWFGFVGACLSNPLAWVGGATYLTIAFIVCYKKMIKNQNKETLLA